MYTSLRKDNVSLTNVIEREIMEDLLALETEKSLIAEH